MKDLIRGEDKTIQFSLKDGAGNAVNFADLPNVVVELYNVYGSVAKYSKVATNTFGSVLAVSGQPTRCKVLLTSAMTSQLASGWLKIVVSTFTTDPDYPTVGRCESVESILYNVR